MPADQYPQQLSSPSLISSGEGLPALSHQLVEKIKAGEYVDFSELPPAKGKGRTSANDWDARMLLLQVQHTDNPSRLILDFPTWAQCFALFTAQLGCRLHHSEGSLVCSFRLRRLEH